MAAEETRLEADRRKALGLAISQIEKSCGKGSIMRMGSERPGSRSTAIPTGAINLDAAIGIGGIPRGRITEIYGPESSGKTTLCLHVVANAQKAGGVAAFIDAEHALDIEYAKKLGVDIENLLVSQPDTGEQALEICEILVRSGAVDIVVIDSVAALVPKAEIEGDMGDSARRPPGAAHEPGAPEAHRRHRPLQDVRDLHQPAAREDRRDVRQSRDDHRRQGAQVLRLGPARHPPHRAGEGARRTSSARTCA